jgi:cell division protein FtsI/penicillin-binding protein 2
MTMMAGLDSGSSHLDDKYYNFNGFNPPQFPQAIGPVKIGDGFDKETFGPVGNNISGYTFTYPVNLLYGYTHSDNIIFAQAGAKAGVNTWLSYNHSLYVEKQIPFDLPVHVSTVTPQKQLCPLNPPEQTTTSLKQVAENAFGQGVDFITPMQMALINNTAANNGHLMRPTLIYKIVDQNQTILQSFNPVELGTPISDTTASEVRDAMYGVIQCGSGSLTQVQLTGSKWSIIGKTGTGQVDNTGKTPAQSWFITQAPYVFQSNQVPRITIVAMKENAGEGGFANGPMLRTIYDRIFTEVLKDVPQSPAPDPNFCFNTGLLQPHA